MGNQLLMVLALLSGSYSFPADTWNQYITVDLRLLILAVISSAAVRPRLADLSQALWTL